MCVPTINKIKTKKLINQPDCSVFWFAYRKYTDDYAANRRAYQLVCTQNQQGLIELLSYCETHLDIFKSIHCKTRYSSPYQSPSIEWAAYDLIVGHPCDPLNPSEPQEHGSYDPFIEIDFSKFCKDIFRWRNTRSVQVTDFEQQFNKIHNKEG